MAILEFSLRTGILIESRSLCPHAPERLCRGYCLAKSCFQYYITIKLTDQNLRHEDAQMTKLVTVALLLLAAVATAEVPHLLTYQGRITDDSGTPLEGSHSLTFRIYDDPTGGTTLWTETHVGVTVSNGLFEVVLGSIETIESSVFSNQPRWLGIRVGLGAELVPRTPIVAVAYAYRAEHADTAGYALDGIGGGGWVDDGSVVRLATGTDSVGIGTVTPAEKLHVNGDIRLNSSSSIAFGSDSSRLYSSSTDMLFTADDDIHLQPDDDIYVRRDGGSAWVHFDNSTERLGIGVTEPQYKLTVNGEISIASGGESKYHINYYQGGLNFAETGVQDRRIHIGDGGNVGIGTANPGAKLGVNGDLKVTGAYKGNISSSTKTDGAPFPRPAYDSGWFSLHIPGDLDLTHNIGGDSTNYFVDLQFKHDGYMGIHNRGLGIDVSPPGYGAAYYGLTSSMITITPSPGSGLTYCDSVRVRIWVIE